MSAGPGASSEQKRLVKERDGYRCRNCGCRGTENNPLTVHHKKPRCKFPWLIQSIKNMITLCQRCHRELEHELALEQNKQRL